MAPPRPALVRPPPSRHAPSALPSPSARRRAAVVFLRRFLPPRLPRLVFFFTPERLAVGARSGSRRSASAVRAGSSSAPLARDGLLDHLRRRRRRLGIDGHVDAWLAAPLGAGARLLTRPAPQRLRWRLGHALGGLAARLASVGIGGCVSVCRRVGRGSASSACGRRASRGACASSRSRPSASATASRFLGLRRASSTAASSSSADPTPRARRPRRRRPRLVRLGVGASGLGRRRRLPAGRRAGRLLGLALERDRALAGARRP